MFFLILGILAFPGISQERPEKSNPFPSSVPPDSWLLPDLQTYEAQREDRLLDIGYLSDKRNLNFDPVLEELVQKAEKQGKVPVIVGFQQEFKVDGLLAEYQIAEQRGEIKRKQTDLLNRLANADIKNLKLFSTIPYFAMTVDADTLRALSAMPEVTSISEDKVSEPQLAESTPLIRAPGAWTAGWTGAGWTIAVIDTGVDKDHPFLSGKVVSEACYSTHDPENDIYSTCPGSVTQSTQPGSGVPCSSTGCDHGTHVAGIAAGTGENFSGVAREANLIAINAASRRFTVVFRDSDVIRSLERVMQLRSSHSIAAVNMSFGIGFYSGTCDNRNPAYTTAVTNLRSVGIPSIIASGNDRYYTGINFPACISSAITVGSTDDTTDTVSSFSNSSAHLTLLAPGSVINSSVPGGGFENKSGTSMAAPHVAGAWAVLKQRTPSASIDTILSKLNSTGVPITDPRNNITKRRIDLGAATDCVSSVTPWVQNVGNPPWSGTVNVTASSGCTWTAVSNSSWLQVTGQASGTGSRSVSLSTSANTGGSRTATVTILGRTIWITQGAGLSACATDRVVIVGQTVTGSLSPSDCFITGQPTRYLDSLRINGTAGQRISVMMQGGQFFPAIYLLDANSTVIGSNTDVPARFPSPHGYFTLPQSGTYRIYAASAAAGGTGNYELTINDEARCAFRFLAPEIDEYTHEGGSGNIFVITEPNCFWIAKRPTSGWLSYPQTPFYGIVGMGSGEVPFIVQPNNGDVRNDVITVDGMEAIITQMAAPTAASVTVAGRAIDASGRGLGGVRVSIMGPTGSHRVVNTSPFGYFRFENVSVGQSYVIEAIHKRYSFIPQSVTVMDEMTDLQIVALD